MLNKYIYIYVNLLNLFKIIVFLIVCIIVYI